MEEKETPLVVETSEDSIADVKETTLSEELKIAEDPAATPSSPKEVKENKATPYKKLVNRLSIAWGPALLIILGAQLINTSFLDGLFGVYHNTELQTRLVAASTLSLGAGWVAGIIITILFFYKYRRTVRWEAIFVSLVVLGFLPLAVGFILNIPPAVDLSNCHYPHPPANNLCETQPKVGWFK